MCGVVLISRREFFNLFLNKITKRVQSLFFSDRTKWNKIIMVT
jgi:hypothetical protein